MRWTAPDGNRYDLEGWLGEQHEAEMAVELDGATAVCPEVDEAVDLEIVSDDGVYGVLTVVTRRRRAAGTLSLRMVGEVRKVQRRRWFRLDVNLRIPGTLRAASGECAPVELHVLNIGGGGLCFESARSLAAGDVIETVLPAEEPVAVQATVLESVELPSGRARARAEFRDISDRDRDRVLSWLFRLQVARRHARRR